MTETRNLIGGEFQNALTNNWLERKNPLNGKTETLVPDSDILDVVRAIQAAHRAWNGWSRTENNARANYLLSVADQLQTRAQDLAEVVSLETGVCLGETQHSIAKAIATFRFFGTDPEAKNSTLLPPHSAAEQSAQLQHQNQVRSNLLPLGLVGIITPAYDPIFTLGSRVAAALSAGNVMIVKPSSFAARSAQIFAECIHSSGLPSGVFNLVQGRGEVVGQAIAQHPGVLAISFAGRTATGISIQQAAAEFLKRTQFSLSASNAALVFEQTDVKSTAKKLVSLALSGETQVSCRVSRIFVHESIFKSFTESFLRETEQLNLETGDPRQPSIRLGPLARSQDRKHFLQSLEQVLAENGKFLCGGPEQNKTIPVELRDGNFVAPTVVTDLSPCSTLYQNEVLGPVCFLRPFKHAHEAIKFTNSSPLSGVAYVFHDDTTAAKTIASRIEASRVFIMTQQFESPRWGIHQGFHGIKLSGYGGEGGDELRKFFSRQTTVASSI